MREISYREAVREALREEMRRDGDVILIGEDIGEYGGGFRVTRGLLDEFGAGRVIETPISETAFVGMATGAAILGLRPVVELMFSDFMGVCFDQIMNEAAKMHFLYNGYYSVPLVIRGAAGAGTGAGAQHSQSLENLYAHIPGLKIAVPSDPYDAKGLMKTAVRDPDPVIFLEEKLLYDTVGEVPEEEYTVPFGRAAVRRKGRDLTIITYGRMVGTCLGAAEILAGEGIDIEVIDLRTLVPLDKETILRSAARTGRVLIVHEAVRFAGFGAEIASEITESEVFYKLRCPVRRVGAAYCPVPSAKLMEKNVLPSMDEVLSELRALMREREKKPVRTRDSAKLRSRV